MQATPAVHRLHEDDLVQVVLVKVRGVRTRTPRIRMRCCGENLRTFSGMNNVLRIVSATLGVAIWATSSGQTPSVLNGGFETYSTAPAAPGEWYHAVQWGNAGSAQSDPDFFHEDGTGGGDLPETPVAVVGAFSGKGVMGFTAATADGANRREYLVGRFSTPLVVGERYRMHFALTNGAITSFSPAGIGVSGLGLAVVQGAPAQSQLEPLSIAPVFVLNQVFYDRDWVEFECTFTANAASDHFVFGVFADDADISFESVEGGNPQIAYYFTDEFSIALAPDEAEQVHDARGPAQAPSPAAGEQPAAEWFVPNAFSPNADGENDMFQPVLNASELVRFEVFSRWGESLFATRSEEEMAWDGTDKKGREVPQGTYVWKLKVRLESGEQRESTGMITLIR